MYDILKFLHVLSMFTGVSALIGGEFYAIRVQRSRDVQGIRSLYRAAQRVDGMGVVAVIVGVVFGVLTALNGSLDLTAPWLLMAYGIFAAIMAVGIGFWTPRSKRILEAAEASPDDAPGPELAALLDRPVDRVVTVIDLLLWASIIFVMVVKPFS